MRRGSLSRSLTRRRATQERRRSRPGEGHTPWSGIRTPHVCCASLPSPQATVNSDGRALMRILRSLPSASPSPDRPRITARTAGELDYSEDAKRNVSPPLIPASGHGPTMRRVVTEDLASNGDKASECAGYTSVGPTRTGQPRRNTHACPRLAPPQGSDRTGR